MDKMDNDLDTDEDEFFDAIESNTLPNLLVHESLTSPTHSQLSLPINFDIGPYSGYKNLRTELSLCDQRPSTSLWSVLKHSIGKDLTKISISLDDKYNTLTQLPVMTRHNICYYI